MNNIPDYTCQPEYMTYKLKPDPSFQNYVNSILTIRKEMMRFRNFICRQFTLANLPEEFHYDDYKIIDENTIIIYTKTNKFVNGPQITINVSDVKEW